METRTAWSKDVLDSNSGGEIIYEWLELTRNGSKKTLIVCGAGISMTGANPAPSGWHAGFAYENYLRMHGVTIPFEVSGDIAKLYEFFCYEEDDLGNKVFSQVKHNQFIDAITDRANDFYFSGKPNFQHDSLINEVVEAGDNLRIYSLNLDEFFDNSGVLATIDVDKTVINASELITRHKSDALFRDWKILAAHGKNVKNSQSVWSHNILSDDGELNTPSYLNGEKDILLKALQCIEGGPYYDYIIFVGLAAPLNYLMKTLIDKLSDGVQWIWINPFDAPKEWLLENEGKPFSEENGEWIKASLAECLWIAQSIFYERWFNNSCSLNSYEIPIVQKYSDIRYKQNLVESLFRARRIFDNGIVALKNTVKNRELVDSFDSRKDIYSYPQKISGNQYSDNSLGMTLHNLYKKEIELDYSFNSRFPALTVAGKVSKNFPISTHVFKVNNYISNDEIAFGIAATFDKTFIDPDHRHVVVLDVHSNSQIPNLTIAIKDELKKRFPLNFVYIDVMVATELEEYLDIQNFDEPPSRGSRP
jgi:hypothetical protein